jgi:3alpha(or 20beta)-hydroxysteroid dehydrogenase
MGLDGLAGRSILVTGGASGIGLATVRRLLRDGAKVTIVDIDLEKLEQVGEELGREDVLTVAADVSDEADLAAVFARAAERFGTVDGIHNNAAVIAPTEELAEIDPAELERVFAVNVRGPFLGTRLMIKAARKSQRPGVVLNVGSSLALGGTPLHGIYCAAKAAVISMTRTAALEAGPSKVRVNAILPGPIETPLLASQPASILEHAAAQNPMGRFGQPREVAAMGAWLLSDESSYVNGGVFLVDGGEQA